MDKLLIYLFRLNNVGLGNTSHCWRVLLFVLSLGAGLSLLNQPSFAQQITLNFKDMDIQLLIDTVAEVTGKTFIVDPRVKGNVTVVSPQPMDRDEVYKTFLSILSVHGFAAITNNGVVKIVPESVAKSHDTPIYSGLKQSAGDELITQVVRVEHVSAGQLVPLLRPLIPQQGHLVAYPANNTLVISDHANNVQRLLRIIRRIDQAADKEIDVMMLEHASASEIVRILNSLEQKNKAKIPTGNSHAVLVADDRTNSVLISGEQSARLRMRALISHLDTPLQSIGNTKVVYLKYAQAADIANVLKGVSDTITEQKKAEGEQQVQIGKTNIQADEATNSLVITAAPDVLQNLENVIRQLDVRRAQVLVEAIIAEITVDTAKNLGVQWLFDGTPSGVGPAGAINFTNKGRSILSVATDVYQLDQGAATSISDTNVAGSFLGLGRFKDSGFNFGMLLQALSSDTQANVLSTPSLLTLDNQEAEIIVGQNVPFVTGQYTNTGTSNSSTNPFQTIQRENVGIKLRVRPQINEGNAVKLEIEQEVSSIALSTVSSADLITNTREIRTTVIIEDGNMIILGGLIDEDLQQSNQKVPGLGDIPILGNLFRSQSTSKVKRNLMVFLRPVIVRDGAQEALVTGGKYNYMRAKQLAQKEQGVPFLDSEDIPVLPSLDDYITVLPGDKPLQGLSPNTTSDQ